MALDPLLAPLVRGFAAEAEEIAETITRALLDLEKGGTEGADEHYREVARGLHTLKGTAGSLGLSNLSELAHRLEDLVGPLRAAREAMSADVADLVLRGLDSYLTTLRATADGRDDSAADVALGVLEQPSPTSRAMLEELAPASQEFDEVDIALRVDAKSATELMRRVEFLRELRLQLGDRRRALRQSLIAAERLPKGQTGELRTLLASLDRGLGADEELAGDILQNLEESLRTVFLQPLRTVLEPLHRGVRDQCRSVGKEAALSIVGAEISLDRRLLDALRASVVQLLRNAVDHGIERPDDRRRAGKHREGSIVVRVTQHGNLVSVEVSDDGGGIDLERVRTVAIERGVVAKDVAAGLTERELAGLIFAPGFSTKAEVTKTSGRGVGLDLVKERIEALGGGVVVDSRAGQGTRVVLDLPVEFGSSPLLVVGVGDHEVAVPMLSVESVLRCELSQVTALRGELRLSVAAELVPIHDLGALLGVRFERAPTKGAPLLLVQSQGRRAALLVDAVLGERDLAILALPAELRHLAAYQGASMEADGRLLMVVKAEWVTDSKVSSASLERRALVIDDSLTARALHRAILEAGGFGVHAVSSAELGLEALRATTYEAVVCDIGMAGMDGLAFAEALRAIPERASTPLVLVSARADAATQREALARGADAFVTKAECAAGRLLAEVRGAVTRRRGAA